MASNYCCYCGIVGSQPISNERTGFNYSSLEVKKKEGKSSTKRKKERISYDELEVELFQILVLNITFVNPFKHILLWFVGYNSNPRLNLLPYGSGIPNKSACFL
jgi:hypothetical protein